MSCVHLHINGVYAIDVKKLSLASLESVIMKALIQSGFPQGLWLGPGDLPSVSPGSEVFVSAGQSLQRRANFSPSQELCYWVLFDYA